eukprot:6146015-Pyramimonas_sp.AAC.1
MRGHGGASFLGVRRGGDGRRQPLEEDTHEAWSLGAHVCHLERVRVHVWACPVNGMVRSGDGLHVMQ